MFIIVTVRIIIPILFRSITGTGRKREISLDKRLSGGVAAASSGTQARWRGGGVTEYAYTCTKHTYTYTGNPSGQNA